MKKLGKKSSLESGTFFSYACNCNCAGIICGACNNCNTKNPTATGSYALFYATQSQMNTKAFSVSAILG